MKKLECHGYPFIIEYYTKEWEHQFLFFYSFVNSTITLQEFVVKFEEALNNRYKAEKREDFELDINHTFLVSAQNWGACSISLYCKWIWEVLKGACTC